MKKQLLTLKAFIVMLLISASCQVGAQTQPQSIHNVKPGMTLGQVRSYHAQAKIEYVEVSGAAKGHATYHIIHDTSIHGGLTIDTVQYRGEEWVSRVHWSPAKEVERTSFEGRHGKPDQCQINDRYQYMCYWENKGITAALDQAKTKVVYMSYTFPK